jgi:hypothetical protein
MSRNFNSEEDCKSVLYAYRIIFFMISILKSRKPRDLEDSNIEILKSRIR